MTKKELKKLIIDALEMSAAMANVTKLSADSQQALKVRWAVMLARLDGQ